MNLASIVTKVETSNLLKLAGFTKKSIFSYFSNKNGHIYISETDFDKDVFLSYAYTSSELIDSLPATLAVDTSTFIVSGSSFKYLAEKDIERNGIAYLVSMKISDEDKENFLIKYCIGEKMIAFSQNSKGLYNNLLRFGENECECRAKMILALIEENKLKY